MRHLMLLTGFLLLMPPAAHAQVTIDLRALEALPNAPRPMAPPRPQPVLRTVPPGPAATAALPLPPVPPNAASASAGPSATSVASAANGPAPPATAPTPPPATLPTGAPAVASLAPIPPPAVPATTAPPAPPPVSATAGTTATAENAGLRLVFKADQSDLSPASSSAIEELVKATPKGDTVTYNVVAYAAGVADDPSIARRLSLARGLSVRAALIADGVASTRIYVRALGASAGDGPPDRVDLTLLGLSGATTAAGGAAKP
jgi:outer membrane protein OmpA-like peptidoglycan-associated protein